jgi:hypothetical protein
VDDDALRDREIVVVAADRFGGRYIPVENQFSRPQGQFFAIDLGQCPRAKPVNSQVQPGLKKCLVDREVMRMAGVENGGKRP